MRQMIVKSVDAISGLKQTQMKGAFNSITVQLWTAWNLSGQWGIVFNTALHWTPEGKRRRGRLNIIWWQMVEKEMQQTGKTWSSIRGMAKYWQKWRDHVAALHATWCNGYKWVSEWFQQDQATISLLRQIISTKKNRDLKYMPLGFLSL